MCALQRARWMGGLLDSDHTFETVSVIMIHNLSKTNAWERNSMKPLVSWEPGHAYELQADNWYWPVQGYLHSIDIKSILIYLYVRKQDW